MNKCNKKKKKKEKEKMNKMKKTDTNYEIILILLFENLSLCFNSYKYNTLKFQILNPKNYRAIHP